MADGATIEEAWALIPQPRSAAAERGSFTSRRIERVIQLVFGLGAGITAAQALVAVLTEPPTAGWHVPGLAVVALVPVAAMVLACLIGRGVRLTAGVVAFCYVIVLILWPLAVTGPDPTPGSPPWSFFLINVATAAAVLAFPMPVQIAYTVTTPVLYGVVRAAENDFDGEVVVGLAVYDVPFGIILGAVLLAVVWLFRRLATGVDGARAQAVDSYAAAAAAEATEQGRVEIAALMHDSVLAALLAAERARSPRERQLAVSMAREALTRLANAEGDGHEGSDEPVARETIAAQLEHAAADLDVPVRIELERGPLVPGKVARALALAGAQAIANAVQHAGGSGLALRVGAAIGERPADPVEPSLAVPAQGRLDERGVSVVVSDSGPGLDVAAIPADRLGIRASIFARMSAVGGWATIASGPMGTAVTLTWRPA